MKNYVKKYRGFEVPEGATHAGFGRGGYRDGFYKKEEGIWYFNNVALKQWYVLAENVNGGAIELPLADEFVPEVGQECEYDHPQFGWTGCMIVGPFRDGIVCAPDGGGFYAGLPSHYRAIKSERDKFIDKVNTIFADSNEFSGMYKAMAIALFDNGARFTQESTN